MPKNKSVIAFMMNMAEDIHGNNILKEYMSIVNRRNSHVNGYMISIQFPKLWITFANVSCTKGEAEIYIPFCHK